LRCKPKPNTQGFTLIELLVVIAIIGVLSSIVLVGTSDARGRAKVIQAVTEMREINTEINLYILDTNRWPSACASTCVASNDPFLNNLGVPGWNGPYMTLWNRTHPWGGHLSIYTEVDRDGDGIKDCLLNLNDDRPGAGEGDNAGRVPAAALLAIDRIIDDGDLTTGNVRGNGGGWLTVEGELVWRCGI
jgi:general secretion pathway protein G